VRWALAVALVLVAFIVAGVSGAFLAQVLGLWSYPVAGPIAASAVVLAAYFSAPTRKLLAALVALLAGAIAAWFILEPSWYPENYGSPRAYQLTHLPLVATYLGGIASLLFVALLRGKARVA
jgi:hypothetical protein